MGFFEIISTSGPHIYHSALLLCPQKSIVRSPYELHARPLTRIVCGLPNSWESSIASTRFPSWIEAAAWSPCSRFIAIPCWDLKLATIVILDGVTLERITTLDYRQYRPPQTQQLAFSQNARLLIWCSGDPEKIISWYLQTGGLVSAIAPKRSWYIIDVFSVTYSACGTMFAVLIHDRPTFTISIYNVLLGTHVYSHSTEGRPLEEIRQEKILLATSACECV
ncbi:hypothetical protein BDM02DRAFT_986061 [Thelephora ganbajun]|uniref:Uncharacterized protein n=1 Tax=Thelephora ganbajun TaxID=370292 RepID=A0ACB6Z3Y6_THEGA|nr:hypothetical protein BDM02DRAFT_986061 [Thelephora ganbajun]